MMELLIDAVPAFITGLVTYFTMKNKNKNNLDLASKSFEVKKTELESEIKQLEMKHEHELKDKELEHQRELEKLKTEAEINSKSKEQEIMYEKSGEVLGQILGNLDFEDVSSGFQNEMGKQMQQELMREVSKNKK